MTARIQWVITVLGQDRPGLVDRLSVWVADVGGDWLDSHLSHIGDQFAGILEVATPGEQADRFEAEATGVAEDTGLALVCRRVGSSREEGTLFSMTCIGQDRPGIIKALTDIFLEFRANVETLDTSYQNAPMSGENLFEAKFNVRLPADVDLSALENRLSSIGEDLMLDVNLQA
jgi:glycine cleavage system regulatory protein